MIVPSMVRAPVFGRGSLQTVLCLLLAGVLLALASCGYRAPYRVGGTGPTTHSHVAHRLLLIGDAGYSRSDSKVLAALKQRSMAAPELTTVVFLGDNIYPAGLPEASSPARAVAEARLQAQLDALLGTQVEAIFMPGNHDWDNSGPDGLAAVLRQQAFVEGRSNQRFRWVPDDGNPGPVCEDRPGVRLVMLDTQWWLHAYSRPSRTEEQVLDALEACLRSAGERSVVILAHHPLQTYGLHGGEATLRDHLFPLTRLRSWLWAPIPGLGSGYVWARRLGVSNQDLSGAKNRHMVAQLERILKKHDPLLYAAGHDHNLQVLRGTKGSAYTLVSGAGSVTTEVGSGEETLFAQQALGFIEVEFTRAQRVLLTVHSEQRDGEIVPQWRMILK